MKILQAVSKLTTGVAVFLTVLCLFFGTVTYLAASEAIAIVAPLAVWAIFLLGLVVAVIVGFDRIQWFLLRRAEYRRDRTLVKNEEKQANYASDRDYMKMVAEAKLLNATIDMVKRGAIHPAALGDGKFSSFPAQVINQIEGQPSLAPTVMDQNIDFEDLAAKALSSRGAGRFIAFGGMDSGKTTLAKHTVRLASTIIGRQGGQVYIIDPHAPKTVWPDGISVIGAGMDYISIRGFLDHVKADVKARYEAGCGDDNQPLPPPYKPNFIICEEWTGVIFALKAMKMWDEDDIRTFYMDSRKAGWGYFLVSHEHTTIALGLSRLGNLLSGVEYFITLEKNAITGQHSATLGTSFKDKEPYNLITPGPFYGPLTYSSNEIEAEREKTEKYPKFSDLTFVVSGRDASNGKEQEIIEKFKAVLGSKGFSWNKATQAAFGEGKFGANYKAKLCRILDEWNIDYSEVSK